MKNYIYTIAGLTIGAILFASAGSAFALSTFITPQGGTGTTSPSGILYGDNGATSHLNTVNIGSNLTFSGGTLSAVGGSPGGASSTIQYNANGAFAGNTGLVYDGSNVGIGTSSPMSTLAVNGSINQYGNGFNHFGTVSSDDTVYCNSNTQCLGYFGNDNSEAGAGIEVGNTNSGAHAYSYLDLTNSLASDGSGLHYSGWFLNSPNYTDATFGTGLTSPSLLDGINTDGGITLATASSTTAGEFINLLVGGFASTNEIARFTTTGLGIGSTSPIAPLVVQSPDNSNADKFIVGSSSAASLVVLPSGKVLVGSLIDPGPTNGAALGVTGSIFSSNGLNMNNGQPVSWNNGNTKIVGTAVAPGTIQFFTGGSEVARFQGTNLGIGTTTPGGTLSVMASGGSMAPNLAFTSAFMVGSSTAGNATTTLFDILSNGNAGLGLVPTIAGDALQVTGSVSTTGNYDIPNGNAIRWGNTNTALTGSATTGSLSVKNNSVVVSTFLGANLGIGSSTPGALLSVFAKDQSVPSSNAMFLIGSSTATATTTLFKVDNVGHMTSSTTPPTISSCGTSPSVLGNDNAFEITVGSVSATACTATFAQPWAAAPVCTISNQSMSVVNALTYTISSTAVTLSQTGLTGDKVDILCQGIAL